jgi:hypothetical protein
MLGRYGPSSQVQIAPPLVLDNSILDVMQALTSPNPSLLQTANRRLAERFRAQGGQVVEVGGHYWREYQKTILPIGPALSNYQIGLEQERALLAAFPKAMMLRYTTGASDNSSWYAVVCDRFTDVEQMKGEDFDKNARYDTRRALKDCTVERVSPEQVAKAGYAVYVAAQQGYEANFTDDAQSRAKFETSILSDAPFDDVIQYFGVFHQGEMIAWAKCTVFGDVEAMHNQIKIDPNQRKARPLFAMTYAINQYYLEQRKTQYVLTGYRNLMHPTGIQKLLKDNFRFKELGLELKLKYRPTVHMAMSLAYPLRSMLAPKSSQLSAMMALEEIRRAYS